MTHNHINLCLHLNLYCYKLLDNINFIDNFTGRNFANFKGIYVVCMLKHLRSFKKCLYGCIKITCDVNTNMYYILNDLLSVNIYKQMQSYYIIRRRCQNIYTDMQQSLNFSQCRRQNEYKQTQYTAKTRLSLITRVLHLKYRSICNMLNI